MSESREWNDHAGPLMDSVNGFDVIECKRCRFRHVVPVPTPQELASTYKEEYYSLEKPLYLERHREDLEWWNTVYAEYFSVFEEFLPPTRRRILDIGSGPGFFLKLGKERGWDTLGIEPSKQAAAHSRGLGLTIVEEFLSTENVASLGRFDVVYMHEVLEHIPDPVGMLKLAHQLLDPGGVLCVVVPNDYNPFQLILREHLGFKPWWVAPPHHVNYFDADTLAGVVERAGFAPLKRTSTFPIDIFLLMGDNYIGNDQVGRAAHARRKQFELSCTASGRGDLKRKLYSQLADLGLGRESVLFARK